MFKIEFFSIQLVSSEITLFEVVATISLLAGTCPPSPYSSVIIKTFHKAKPPQVI